MRSGSLRTAVAFAAFWLGLAFRSVLAGPIIANDVLAPGGGSTFEAFSAADPPIDVGALLQKLAPDTDFEERERAKETLRDALLNNRLTTEQLAQIRQVAVGRGPGLLGTLEGTMRVGQIFAEFVRMQPTVRMLQTAMQATITRETDTGGFQYEFGGERGQIRGGDRQGFEDFFQLQSLAGRAVDRLMTGDTEGAKARLEELKAFITGLSDERFHGLRFRLNRGGMLRIIQDAIDKIPQAEKEILQAAGPPQGARQDVPIPGPGQVNPGGTFVIDIPTVIVPGGVTMFWPIDDLLPALPPPGFQFAGYSAFVIPDDVIDIDGPVRISFQYGPGLLFGNPVIDSNRLSLVRFANGIAEPLEEGFFNDQGAFLISASYSPPPHDSGLDQFGFFAVVQRTPEPSTAMLLVLGAVWLVWQRRRAVRRGMSPRVA